MLINNLEEMLQDYPVEQFHHSIWPWVKGCSSGAADLQLLAHLCVRTGLIQSSFPGPCAALMGHHNVKFNFPQTLKLFLGYLWLVLDMFHIICWSNWSSQEYADCPFGNDLARYMAILLNGRLTLCLCNSPYYLVCCPLVAVQVTIITNPIFYIVFVGGIVKLL